MYTVEVFSVFYLSHTQKRVTLRNFFISHPYKTYIKYRAVHYVQFCYTGLFSTVFSCNILKTTMIFILNHLITVLYSFVKDLVDFPDFTAPPLPPPPPGLKMDFNQNSIRNHRNNFNLFSAYTFFIKQLCTYRQIYVSLGTHTHMAYK